VPCSGRRGEARHRARRAGRIIALAAVAGALATATGVLADEPDLIVDAARLATSWSVRWRYFAEDACALEEACITAPGYRKILRFSTETANIGMGDLVLGSPIGNPLFEYSPCHDHYHFGEYAKHELLDPAGNQAAPGVKAGFCLLDSRRYLNEPWVPLAPAYTCSFQGLQRGWSDVYGSGLDCQWIDVTGVPDGAYTLRVTVNPAGVLDESDKDNNSATVAVVLSEPAGIAHRPDGRFTPGAPLRVEPAGSQVRVTYDVASCPAADYNLLYGDDAGLATYDYLGAFCNLGTDGQEVVTLPSIAPGRLIWLVVVGRSGTVEGGHGFDSAGVQRPLTGQGLCGILNSQPTLACSSPGSTPGAGRSDGRDR
jgi:hypothetical protein